MQFKLTFALSEPLTLPLSYHSALQRDDLSCSVGVAGRQILSRAVE